MKFLLLAFLTMNTFAYAQDKISAGKEFVDVAFKDLNNKSAEEKNKYTNIGQNIPVKNITHEEFVKILSDLKFPEACLVKYKLDGKSVKFSLKIDSSQKLKGERVKLTDNFNVSYTPKRTVFGVDFKARDREESFLIESGTPGESDRLSLVLNSKGEFFGMGVADKDSKATGMDLVCEMLDKPTEVKPEVVKDTSRVINKDLMPVENVTPAAQKNTAK